MITVGSYEVFNEKEHSIRLIYLKRPKFWKTAVVEQFKEIKTSVK